MDRSDGAKSVLFPSQVPKLQAETVGFERNHRFLHRKKSRNKNFEPKSEASSEVLRISTGSPSLSGSKSQLQSYQLRRSWRHEFAGDDSAMILYDNKSLRSLCKCKGSVFPQAGRSICGSSSDSLQKALKDHPRMQSQKQRSADS